MDITTSVLTPNTHVVVLDLDGTLYNKSGMIGEMMLLGIGQWWRLLAERKTRKAFRGQYLGCEELFYSTYYRAIANRTAFSEKYISNWYQNTYMPMMVEVIRRWHQPMAWVVPFAKACHEKGVKLVVLSDYGHAKEKLQALGLDIQLFDWVVSAPASTAKSLAKGSPMSVAELNDAFGDKKTISLYEYYDALDE